ncbi:YraN family protein [Candidatus Microgenomates bacterium]|nr:YraN family protein [Candidatus Microgenomates bacterium]
MSKRNVNLGRFGEEKAVEYLQKHGYKVLEQNFRSKYGEIDIIAVNKDFLIFIEVKTRWSEKCGLPEEAVTQRKIRSITRTSQYYKILHPETSDLMRIDVIAIELDSLCRFKELRHLKNVTGTPY